MHTLFDELRIFPLADTLIYKYARFALIRFRRATFIVTSFLALLLGLLSMQSRIIAIPLARPKANSHSSRLLIYYHFDIIVPPQVPITPFYQILPPYKYGAKWDPPMKTLGRLFTSTMYSFFDKRAVNTVYADGMTLKGSVYKVGEWALDNRLPFEEVALKEIEIPIGTVVSHIEDAIMSAGAMEPIPLFFPPSIISGPQVLDQMRYFVRVQKDVHMKYHNNSTLTWMGLGPMATVRHLWGLPVGIKNFTIGYDLWRRYSHFKALKAAEYMQILLDNGLIFPQENKALDEVLKKKATPPAPNTAQMPVVPTYGKHNLHASDSEHLDHELLIRKEAIPNIIREMTLKPGAVDDLIRAFRQARHRVEDGDIDLHM
ncbi:hypothetical protein M422DRAFT_776233 [Sphaerobolus stellatus SS14]|nr:hypothetical protein M422DRAFT_776233 [Sphaerobolus stellatus SS14]